MVRAGNLSRIPKVRTIEEFEVRQKLFCSTNRPHPLECG